MGRAGRYCYREVLPVTALVGIECVLVGGNTLFKSATSEVVSYCVLVTYAYLAGTLFLIPLAVLIYRRKNLPPLNSSVLFNYFLIALLGYLSQMLGYIGINYASPTLSSAISNLIPAFTFILAIVFRMEKVDLKSSSSQAKVIGTVVAIAGAFLVTLYKGPAVIRTPSPSPALQSFQSSEASWVAGGLAFVIQCLLLTLQYFVQCRVLREYPNEVVLVFAYNLIALLISTAIALIIERDLAAWKVEVDRELLLIIYMGIFGGVGAVFVYVWALHMKGPVYVAMFKPSSVFIAVAMGVVFLGDTLHIGSVLGAAIMVVGFYAVLWGKAKEEIGEDNFIYASEASPTQRLPLLQNNDID